jgi:hypothetical protein
MAAPTRDEIFTSVRERGLKSFAHYKTSSWPGSTRPPSVNASAFAVMSFRALTRASWVAASRTAMTMFETQLSMLDDGLPITLRNSRRVRWLVRNSPCIAEVTMVTPVLWTPRVVMH